MATLIPNYKWTDFQKVAKLGKLSELKSCEITFNGECLFTFMNSGTDYVRTQAEYLAMRSNSVAGKELEQILEESKEEALATV